MSVLGPISTLQPARPATYLDFDFSKGDVPPELVYSRAGDHGVWSKDGRYSVVGQNVPPITWVPELNSYALALEPAANNYVRTTASRPLGLNFGGGATIVSGIDAPDGSPTALRVSGTWSGGIPAAEFGISGSTGFVQVTWFVRPEGDWSPRFAVYSPSPVTAWFLTARVNKNTLAVDYYGNNSYPGSGRVKVRRVWGGWLMCECAFAVPDNAVTVSLYTNAAASSGSIDQCDWWFPQITKNACPTSFILPGAAVTARSNYTAGHPVSGGGKDFSVMAEMLLSRHGASGGAPFHIRGSTAQGDRFRTTFSTDGLRYQALGSNGSAFGMSVLPFYVGLTQVTRVAANIGWGRSDAVANNETIKTAAGPASPANAVSSVMFGDSNQESFGMFLSRLRVFSQQINLGSVTRL